MGEIKKSSRTTSAFQIILSGFCFGFLGIWGKWAFSLGLTAGELLGLRFLLAAAILFIYLFWRQLGSAASTSDQCFPWLSQRDLILCLLLGVLGYAVFSSFYFAALSGLSVSLTVLLLYLFPVMVAVGARVFLKEHLGPRGLLSLPLALAGTALLVWGEFSVHNQMAFFAGIMSAVTYSVYVLISRKQLAAIDPLVATAWMQLATGAVLTAYHFRSGSRILEVIELGWIPIFGIAFFSSVLPMTLFLKGLKGLKAAEASVLNTSEPLTATLVAGVLLGESLTIVQLLGGVLVIAAMLLIATRKTETN